jgi:hypothetical protein
VVGEQAHVDAEGAGLGGGGDAVDPAWQAPQDRQDREELVGGGLAQGGRLEGLEQPFAGERLGLVDDLEARGGRLRVPSRVTSARKTPPSSGGKARPK